MGGDFLITVTKQGKFLIPEKVSDKNFKANNLKLIRKFFVEDITDISLVYRMYLNFDDGTSTYFILESDVKKGGTELVWNTFDSQLLKSGIVNMQIKASNGSGEVFRSEAVEIFVHTYVEFLNEKAVA